MNKSVVAMMMVCGVFAGAASPASAQMATWADRGYINVGWGVESGSSAMSDTRTSTVYEETATVTSAATFTSGSLFDVGAGLRVWKNLTVGAAYHQEQNDTDGELTGSVPSPIFFNRPRTFSATVPGLERKEKATHAMIGWVFPFGDRFDAMIYGGPSFFRVEQTVVSNVTFTEGATNVVATPTETIRKKSQTGYNVGTDVTYIVWSNDSIRLGVGGFFRFSTADLNLEMLRSEQETKAGGAQFGFGARLRF